MAYVDTPIAEDLGYSGSSNRVYAVEDANWNVINVVGGLGFILYDPYGKPSGYSTTWDFYFQGGRYSDPYSEILNFRNRDYSPTLGRWLEQDPIGYQAKDTNLYRFVYNSPVNHTDPNGEIPRLLLLASGIIIWWLATPSYANAPGPTDRAIWRNHYRLGVLQRSQCPVCWALRGFRREPWSMPDPPRKR
jgi:RHS repeat-associated protein